MPLGVSTVENRGRGCLQSWIHGGIMAGLPAEDVEQYGSISNESSASGECGVQASESAMDNGAEVEGDLK